MSLVRRLPSFFVHLIAGGAIAAPSAVSGHGSEFFQAKLALPRQGGAVLEIVADYGQNPMIENEDAAKKALPECLRLRASGNSLSLAELGELTFERRDQWPAGSPLSAATADPSARHELLALACRFKPEAQSIQFENPKGNLHDVLLWISEESSQPAAAKDSQGPKWAMLLGGDLSPEIHLPSGKKTFPLLATATVTISLLALCLLKPIFHSKPLKLSRSTALRL